MSAKLLSAKGVLFIEPGFEGDHPGDGVAAVSGLDGLGLGREDGGWHRSPSVRQCRIVPCDEQEWRLHVHVFGNDGYRADSAGE